MTELGSVYKAARTALKVFDTVAALLADTALTYTAGTKNTVASGDILYAGGHRYSVAASGASDHHVSTSGSVKLYVLRNADGRVSQLAFGAVGDGTTDDTTACQAAHDAGMPIADEATFAINALSAKVAVYGGKYLRRSGQTGSFVTIGAANVHLDCEVDMNSVGEATNHAVSNTQDGFSTGSSFICRNAVTNGVDSRNANNVTIRGKVIDAVQTHVFVFASTQDISGLYIDVTVDGSALGTSQLNGGVKVHCTGGHDVFAPFVRADVTLAENASMPANAVGVELFGFNSETPSYEGTESFVRNAVVEATCRGGSIGCTLHGGLDVVATVRAVGQHNLGLEITAGSLRCHFAEGSRVSAGAGGVGPSYGATIAGQSNDCTIVADVTGITNARDANAAGFYINRSERATISGQLNQGVGSQMVRVRDADDLCIRNLRASGSTSRAILLDLDGGTCDRIRAQDCDFSGITNFIQATGTFDGGVFANCRIDNSGLFIAGSPTLTGYRFDEMCNITTLPFGTGAKHITIHDYVAGGACLLTLTRTGTPEGFITAAIGSVCRRDDGGAATSLYVKESGTSSTGWVAK